MPLLPTSATDVSCPYLEHLPGWVCCASWVILEGLLSTSTRVFIPVWRPPNPPFGLLPTPLRASDFSLAGATRAAEPWCGPACTSGSSGQVFGGFELLMLCPALYTSPLGINRSPKIGALESIHPAPSSVLCPLSSIQLQHGPSAGICPHELSGSHCLPFCCQVSFVSTNLLSPSLPSQISCGGTLQCDTVGVIEVPCMDLRSVLSSALALPAWWHLKSGAQNCLPVAPPVLEAHVEGLCLQQEFEGISAKARPWQGWQSVQHKVAFEPMQRPRVPLLPVRESYQGGIQNGARRRAASGSGRTETPGPKAVVRRGLFRADDRGDAHAATAPLVFLASTALAPAQCRAAGNLSRYFWIILDFPSSKPLYEFWSEG